jgi:hypothetical protein
LVWENAGREEKGGGQKAKPAAALVLWTLPAGNQLTGKRRWKVSLAFGGRDEIEKKTRLP